MKLESEPQTGILKVRHSTLYKCTKLTHAEEQQCENIEKCFLKTKTLSLKEQNPASDNTHSLCSVLW